MHDGLVCSTKKGDIPKLELECSRLLGTLTSLLPCARKALLRWMCPSFLVREPAGVRSSPGSCCSIPQDDRRTTGGGMDALGIASAGGRRFVKGGKPGVGGWVAPDHRMIFCHRLRRGQVSRGSSPAAIPSAGMSARTRLRPGEENPLDHHSSLYAGAVCKRCGERDCKRCIEKSHTHCPAK